MAEPASAARDTVPGTGSADSLEAAMPDTTPRPPRAERRRAGLEARAACPLESLGAFEARGGRAEAVALVAGQSADRVPSLVPLRYERMRVSPFTFLRGSAVIMADDLSRMPATGLRVQCVGDAHIANFGIFASPTRRLVFDVNDFDETAPGPWEWDVMRLVASVEACGRDRGFSKSERHHAVKRAARAYRRGMERFAGMGELEIWYDHLDLEDLVAKIEGVLPGGQSWTLRREMRKASG